MPKRMLYAAAVALMLSTHGCPILLGEELLHVGHCWHGTHPCGGFMCCNQCGRRCN